jgi:hypothetical protein
MEIDSSRIRRYHADPSGATTVVHEFHHAPAFKNGGDPVLGDLPSSATGPAEIEGQRVAAEEPDISEADAVKIYLEILSEPPEF